jgi:hypothetical protein
MAALPSGDTIDDLEEETLVHHGIIDLEEEDQLTPLMLCAQNGDRGALMELLASQPETVNVASPKYKVPNRTNPYTPVYRDKQIQMFRPGNSSAFGGAPRPH